ncbi:MAG: hypothetical protein Harvfovirus60_10, partial [Harvfovirus sp.]
MDIIASISGLLDLCAKGVDVGTNQEKIKEIVNNCHSSVKKLRDWLIGQAENEFISYLVGCIYSRESISDRYEL